MRAFLNVDTWLKFITGVWRYFCEIGNFYVLFRISTSFLWFKEQWLLCAVFIHTDLILKTIYRYKQKSVKRLVKCTIKYVGNSFTTYPIFGNSSNWNLPSSIRDSHCCDAPLYINCATYSEYSGFYEKIYYVKWPFGQSILCQNIESVNFVYFPGQTTISPLIDITNWFKQSVTSGSYDLKC